MAQTLVEGVVKDSVGVVIPYANVFIQEEGKTAILTFAYTNEEGEYTISLKKRGSFVLNVSSLSFKKKRVLFEIDSIRPQSVIHRDVVLSRETLILDEVVVNSNIPIIRKKDTISFKVNHFTDGTEEVIEDVLKKLPGIDVSEDGNITVQGKSIEKVMVEGDDLFEKGYKLLTKNLNSEVLDKVEVLEKFSNNALLKGIEDSDKVALNLTLKEDRKTSLFGNATVGYGSEQFYENRLNLISFNKKSKYYFFGGLNNIGTDPTGDIYQLINPNALSGTNYIGDGLSANEFVNIGTFTPNLNSRRVNINNAELASLSGIFNPSDKLKIKGLLFFNTDENDFFRNSITQFFIGDDSFTNTEDLRVRKKIRTGFGKWDAIYSLSKDSRIEYSGKYNISNKEDVSRLIFNNEEINQFLDTDNHFTDQRITYTKRIEDKSAILITGRYLYDERPQTYRIDDFIFDQLFPELNDIVAVHQNIDSKLNFFGIEGDYIVNSKNANLEIKLGYSNTKNNLNSQLSFIDQNDGVVNAGNEFFNALDYQLNDIFGKLRYKYRINKVELRASLEPHQLWALVGNEGTISRESSFYVIPGLSLNWLINKKNKFSILYRFNTRNFSLTDIQNNFILTGFRNFDRGVGEFDQLRGNVFLTSYVFGDWADEFLVNTSFLLQKENEYRSSSTEISPNFSLSERIILDDKTSYSWNLNIDKFIDKLSSNIKINGSVSESSFQNIVNNSDLRDIKTTTYSYGMEIRSAFSGFFNFHVGTNWNSSRVETNIESTNTDNKSFLDMTFDLSRKLTFKLINERYYFGNLDQNNTFYFTDLDLQYVLKKNRLKFKFTAQNLWNTNTFANFFIGDTNRYSTEYRLQPRYFLFKLDFRF
ncbi:TonB-dependent receptor [Leptobacterium flavescens]|uniref:TonB-dependent receptor n=1 Tax=Leptobacterium flavescens TaxID=472055 RepID=A0A6P0UI77_9FLAO|nr:carboxypeptidase-like regulatory domain-containing protein [Leptobacterium flavescens]NER12954.1 TonB-dependent receptor [Leptobacterium flavescens]